MKQCAAALMAFMVALVVGAGDLQAQRALGFNLGAGPTIPIGEGKGTGFHLNGGIGFAPGALPVGVRLEGMYQRIPEGADHHNYLAGILNAEVGLPLAGLQPYLIGGVGLYRHEEHHGDHAHDPHTDFGLNIGVGTRLGLFGVNAYIEARYHHLFNGNGDHDHGHNHGHGDNHTGDTFIPITIGISLPLR